MGKGRKDFRKSKGFSNIFWFPWIEFFSSKGDINIKGVSPFDNTPLMLHATWAQKFACLITGFPFSKGIAQAKVTPGSASCQDQDESSASLRRKRLIFSTLLS